MKKISLLLITMFGTSSIMFGYEHTIINFTNHEAYVRANKLWGGYKSKDVPAARGGDFGKASINMGGICTNSFDVRSSLGRQKKGVGGNKCSGRTVYINYKDANTKQGIEISID
ncbi:MAG: hypothetical protein WDZ41_05455 [Candidatus Babeliales bacterium]